MSSPGTETRAGFIGRRARSWICLLVSPRSSQRPAGPPFRRALPWSPSVECGAAGPASWASFYRNHIPIRHALSRARKGFLLLTQVRQDRDRRSQSGLSTLSFINKRQFSKTALMFFGAASNGAAMSGAADLDYRAAVLNLSGAYV